MDHVAAILSSEVRLECSSVALRGKLGSMVSDCEDDDADVCLPFSSKEELARILTQLQNFCLAFGSEPAGWSPASVFEQLRDEGLVQGKIKTVVWRGRGDPVVSEV
jgi:hypothetical protein